MSRCRKSWRKMLLTILMAAAGLWMSLSAETQAAGQTKIHFISLNSTTDAILLESNGHYGLVDSGEDWDYPDGETYELRDGVTQGIGYEQQVIHYLEELGVEKLDFYIATHAHSDHIGSGDEILDHFPTDRLYINDYDDSQIDTSESDAHLWDNQYVYDCLIEAAKRNGTQIITRLDAPENKGALTFTMGDMQIELMNYERERETRTARSYPLRMRMITPWSRK